jgi:DNA-binding NarL/FixJ family response regulator
VTLSVAKPLRVVIAENHADLSDVVARLIDAEPDMHCVGQVRAATDVIAAVRESSADALVLDLSLQGGSGMGLIEDLATRLPQLRIVVFSGLANDDLARETIHRGAAAFVIKGSDPNVLLDELRRASDDDHDRSIPTP